MAAKIDTLNTCVSFFLGFERIAELLIEKGVDVDVVGSGNGSQAFWNLFLYHSYQYSNNKTIISTYMF